MYVCKFSLFFAVARKYLAQSNRSLAQTIQNREHKTILQSISVKYSICFFSFCVCVCVRKQRFFCSDWIADKTMEESSCVLVSVFYTVSQLKSKMWRFPILLFQNHNWNDWLENFNYNSFTEWEDIYYHSDGCFK